MSEGEKTFNEYLKIEALRRWGGWEGFAGAFHDNGDGSYHVYKTIAIGGVKPEGEGMLSCPTVFQAAEALFKQLENYLGDSPPVWRQFPQVSRDGKRFYATARVAREEMR